VVGFPTGLSSHLASFDAASAPRAAASLPHCGYFDRSTAAPRRTTCEGGVGFVVPL
jgi:hypothetical protein